MNYARRFGGLDYLLLLLVVACAAGTRCWYVGVCAQNGTSAGPLQVQDVTPGGWAELAENVSRDAGYAVRADDATTLTRVAHPAPLYPWLLAALRRLAPD